MDWTKPQAYRKKSRPRLVWSKPRKTARKSRSRAKSRAISIPFALALLAMSSAGATIGLIWPDSSSSLGKTSGNSVHFGSCHSGGGFNCVVDGDTFYFKGDKIRIADIDAPETHPPRCAREDALGSAATDRLRRLLNAGPIDLVSSESRDRDQYGRLLRTVERDGDSLGGQLVDEGLARWYGNGRRSWC